MNAIQQRLKQLYLQKARMEGKAVGSALVGGRRRRAGSLVGGKRMIRYESELQRHKASMRGAKKNPWLAVKNQVFERLAGKGYTFKEMIAEAQAEYYR